MKNLTLMMLSFLAFTFIILNACKKDQILLNEIVGEYQIESIVDYVNDEPISQNATGAIYFEKCKLKSSDGGNCSGWYELDGQARVTFVYGVDQDRNTEVMSITSLSQPSSDIILGGYGIETRENDKLILESNLSTSTKDRVTTTSYSVIKLKRK